jgi:hypothetical protein
MRERISVLGVALLLLTGCATGQGATPVATPTATASQGAPEPQAEGQAQEEQATETTAAAAQPTAEQESRALTLEQQAVLRVREVTIEPSALSLNVGERVSVAAIARDADGQPVDGVQVRQLVRGAAASYEAAAGEVLAVEPGDATLFAFVLQPGPEGGPPQTVVARADIRVAPLPVSRIEIERPERPIFAGARYRLGVRAYSPLRERPDASVEWASSNPDVAWVSDLGYLTAGQTGQATLTARSEGVTAALEVEVQGNPVRSLTIEPTVAQLLTGEVTHFTATALDASGRMIEVPIEWTAAGVSGQLVETDFVDGAGTFVASFPGEYLVTATVGGRSATAQVAVQRRPGRRSVELIAHGVVPEDHNTSDLWVFEGLDGRDYAYTGTHAGGAGGNVMFAWDVTDPSNPVITDSVVVDARVVNDVKVNREATLAVITREGASNRRNGLVILDLQDPAHPTILSEYTETLTGGVHNTWIEGDYVYAIHDGTLAMHIIDISDPANPSQVGRWEIDKEDKYLHDVMIQDGLAYLSYWDDGLVILDVGAGIKGGTPTEPQFVSSIPTKAYVGSEIYGNTHHAIRYKNYVFLGDEIFGCEECVNGPRGYVHVIDVTDIEQPREVAWYQVPEAGTHNLWVEDEKMYIAYYQGGVRVVHVSGELRGDLYRQGREIGWYMTEDDSGFSPHRTMAWGPQPYKGLLYISDMNSGLWVVRVDEPQEELVP